MIQPNEQLIETIEKALEAATPGEWMESGKQIIQKKRDGDGYHAVIATASDRIGHMKDLLLIANAPEWLRALLEENKRLQNDLKMETRDRETWEAEVQKLAEERHDLINEVDSLKDARFELRTEISAKDKVIEEILERVDEIAHRADHIPSVADLAHSILSQYKGEDTNETNTD